MPECSCGNCWICGTLPAAPPAQATALPRTVPPVPWTTREEKQCIRDIVNRDVTDDGARIALHRMINAYGDPTAAYLAAHRHGERYIGMAAGGDSDDIAAAETALFEIAGIACETVWEHAGGNFRVVRVRATGKPGEPTERDRMAVGIAGQNREIADLKRERDKAWDRIANLESKITEIERTSADAKIHIDKLSVQNSQLAADRDTVAQKLAAAEVRDKAGAVVAGEFAVSRLELRSANDRIAELNDARNRVYTERNQVVAAFAKMAQRAGFPVGLSKHDPSPGEWDKEWTNIVYIEHPVLDVLPRLAQCSWHIHDNDLPLFSFLKPYTTKWDGHTTEGKYQRLADFCMNPHVPVEMCSPHPLGSERRVPRVVQSTYVEPTTFARVVELATYSVKVYSASLVDKWIASKLTIPLPEEMMVPYSTIGGSVLAGEGGRQQNFGTANNARAFAAALLRAADAADGGRS